MLKRLMFTILAAIMFAILGSIADPGPEDCVLFTTCQMVN